MPTRASTSKSQEPEPASKEVDEPEADDVEEEQEEDDDDEGEYEVDKVIAHRPDGPGKFEYLVSWKGYGPEHNTWEPQDNLDHATDLVSAHWAKQPKADLGVKKRGRVSAAPEERATKTPRVSASGAKKGRPSQNGKHPAEPETEEEEDDDAFEFSESHVDSIEKYKDIQDWEDLVKSVDTIERGSDKKLMVYLTMIGGEKIGLPKDVAYARCPQIILMFYEDHLKWRVAD